MANVGIAGLGFMGMIHYLAYQRMKGAKVVAMAEQDATKLSGDWRAIKGNFGPPGEMMDLSRIARYPELDQMLADPKVDCVDICLPPAAHASVAIAALKAGKHVFCEKPIALTAADAKRMVKAAEDSGKLLFIGHVLQFFPEYAFAHKAIKSGKYGKLLGAHFKRIISDPLWLRDFYDPKKVGGPMLDLHVHDAHYIRLVCGMPKAVSTSGRMRGDVAEFFTSQFLFDDSSLSVTATSGVIQQQGRAFTHGYEIHLERATLLYDFSVLDGKPELSMPVTLLAKDGTVQRPEMGSADPIDAFVSELTEAQKSIKAGRPSPLLDGQLASDAVVLCDKQTQSLVKHRLVKI
jgi:predicted dehydrogenase